MTGGVHGVARRIDLFSDTTTRPTVGMRQAMAAAQVGDEQRNADPTVLALQSRVADLLGMEAALFLPSTTMANQIALKLHTDPGDEVILDALSHPLHAEAGGAGIIAGVLFRPIETERGIFTPEQLAARVRPRRHSVSRTRLAWIENTHNFGGGSVWPVDLYDAVCRTAREHGLAVHVDGARLLNAAVALGLPARRLVQGADTVSFCLSKGLGAPVGGLIAGSREMIDRARRLKQALGGAMRQAGVLAAAGLYALDHHVERLADDHRRARRLAEGLAEIPGIAVDLSRVETNMVYFGLDVPGLDVPTFAERLAARGLDLSVVTAAGGPVLRAVTHLDVGDADIEEALRLIRETLG